MVEHHDLVARRQPQRSQHRVASDGRVLDENQVVLLGPDELGQTRRRAPQRPWQLVDEEPRRLRLHPRLPLALRREHHARGGAERAVIDRQEVGIQPPLPADGVAEPELSVGLIEPQPIHRSAPQIRRKV